MPPPAYAGEGGNMQSGCDVCDGARISGTAEATDFKIKILCVYSGLG